MAFFFLGYLAFNSMVLENILAASASFIRFIRVSLTRISLPGAAEKANPWSSSRTSFLFLPDSFSSLFLFFLSYSLSNISSRICLIFISSLLTAVIPASTKMYENEKKIRVI